MPSQAQDLKALNPLQRLSSMSIMCHEYPCPSINNWPEILQMEVFNLQGGKKNMLLRNCREEKAIER